MVKNAYDIAVIGAGPAGLMAAVAAAQNKARVILIEKNERPGKKLLLTGKGRCNITHLEEDIPTLCDAFGKKGKFLFTALQQFAPQDVIDFFNKNQVETKVERGQRVFPVSDKAEDVLKALRSFLRKKKVMTYSNCTVKKFINKNGLIGGLTTAEGEIRAKQYILCTGGMAYPTTGSAGQGYKLARQLHHTVIEPVPALVPLKAKELWVRDLQGLSLKNVQISLYQNGKKQTERFGEALFTHEGMSGPIILDMSKEISALLQTGKVELRLDFKPALDYPKLDQRIQRDWQKMSNKMYKNSLDDLLPQKLIPVIVRLSGIDPDKKVNVISKEERSCLLHLLKELPLTVRSLHGFEKAIVTAGGVDLKEIDPRTMRSKLVENLYFAGEIIDLDGPTGGYNLQMCWSTGHLAGESAADVL